jgi:hypothetical protein
MIKETLSSLMVNGQPAQEAVKGDKITLKFATKVTPSDKLYKIVEATHA